MDKLIGSTQAKDGSTDRFIRSTVNELIHSFNGLKVGQHTDSQGILIDSMPQRTKGGVNGQIHSVNGLKVDHRTVTYCQRNKSGSTDRFIVSTDRFIDSTAGLKVGQWTNS